MQFEEVQLIVIDQKKKKLNLLLHALKFLKYFNLFESEKIKNLNLCIFCRQVLWQPKVIKSDEGQL